MTKGTRFAFVGLLTGSFITHSGFYPQQVLADAISINHIKSAVVTKVDSTVQKYKSNFSYINIGLTYHGAVVFSKSYGNNNVKNAYVYASVSKTTMSTIIMKLFEAGEIPSLDDPLGKYLSSINGSPCTQTTYTSSPVTIRHLLSHRSGIPHNDKPTCSNGSLNLQFQPGSSYMYSTPGYGILGELAEHITGKTFSQLIQEMIATPIGATTFRVDDRFDAPGGFVYSNVDDLAAFSAGIYTWKYLSSDTLYNLVWQPLSQETSGLGMYGLGWLCSQCDTVPDLIVFHPGSNATDVATIRIKPAKAISVGLLARASLFAPQNPLEPVATDLLTLLENDPDPIDPTNPLATPTPTIVISRPGDLSGDSQVDRIDYELLIPRYAQPTTSGSMGDFNSNNLIDLYDIHQLLNYMKT